MLFDTHWDLHIAFIYGTLYAYLQNLIWFSHSTRLYVARTGKVILKTLHWARTQVSKLPTPFETNRKSFTIFCKEMIKSSAEILKLDKFLENHLFMFRTFKAESGLKDKNIGRWHSKLKIASCNQQILRFHFLAKRWFHHGSEISSVEIIGSNNSRRSS